MKKEKKKKTTKEPEHSLRHVRIQEVASLQPRRGSLPEPNHASTLDLASRFQNRMK